MSPPKDYLPIDRWPDFDGAAGTGPVQLQEDGDEMLWWATYRNDFTIATTSNTTPIVITTTAPHVFFTGTKVGVKGSGVANAEGPHTITVINSTSFSLNGTTAGGTGSTGRVYDTKLGLLASLIDGLAWLYAHIGEGVLSTGTWLGTLVVNGTPGGHQGVIATGTGNQPGLAGQGGPTSGIGTVGVGGAPNGGGVQGLGTGTGYGGNFVAGSGGGNGIQADNNGGGGFAIYCGDGNQVFAGTQPVKTADPGADNLACGTNIEKAWAQISCTSSTPAVIDGGYNVASAVIDSGTHSFILVTFARPMADAHYVITFGNEMDDYYPFVDPTTKTVNGFHLERHDRTTFGAVNFNTGLDTAIGFRVAGRQ